MSLTAAIYLLGAAVLAHKVTRWLLGTKPKAWPFTKDFI